MHYRLSADPTAAHYIDVEARLTDVVTPFVAFQLPAWRPGRYELQQFAKNIQRFTIVDADGKPLPFRKTTKDRWLVETNGASELTVRYNYYALLPTPNLLNAGSSFVSDTLLYVNPVNLCVYAEGRINEPCTLELGIPANWMVACGLQQDDDRLLRAADFYELVDCPLMAAPIMQHVQYEVQDTVFHVWIQGGRRTDGNPTFDADRIVRDFSLFSEKQIELYGEFPERDYHFLTLILPVAHYHGVEHRNSTMLVLGPNDEGEGLYQDLLGVASHELFHAWNIIRIRPAELLPYDFTKENYFETCFVAEGVTTYYGDLILRQSDVFDDSAYLKELQVLFKRHFENNGRAAQSLAESSWDLWLDGYEKGVPDRKVSVYHKGAIAALILDLHIRRLTNHARSLDDVMRTMWEQYGKPFVGYRLDDYRAVTEAVAGESLTWYYDLCIFGNQPLESLLNEYLAWVGLAIVYEEAELPGGIRLLEHNDPEGWKQRVQWLGGIPGESSYEERELGETDGKSVVAK
ncbi:M61 family metallopeptidase [Spirosoma utsteinense]|uniref:Metalloprotease with PDZ domain n=1 Tax=Spirosoma utsteinense TaxID=2585773 RepID=A0ABR6WDQ9_9BACT|nr:M61 family metallopeptidase [Spirosoma utsteinense]MBC3788740.1 putative metalloprotease with PDZ domain [Spirosoma utsteinense]MBC3794140.1 putative metalloprotease with PDZ domain [Spirosoma utsteinense]